MRDYIIMTDSCCDLTDHMARELELTVVPLTVHIDGQDYPNLLDGSAISFEDFYTKIRSGKLATPSAANVGQFQDAMRPVLESGKDIVCISFSSALSTTYQSASIAANDMRQEFPSDDVEAFLFSGTTVFDPYKLKEMEEDCKGIEPIMVGDIEGDSYDAADPACMENIRFVERSGGPLKVWAGPDNSEIVKHRYIVACDIGGSHKTSDFSDIVVFDRYDEIYGGVPELVAEWHGHCDADQLAMRCAQIAHFYNDAYLVIENNTAYSRMNNTEGNQSELFFPILLPLYDNLYSASQSKLKKVKNIEMKWGFNTNKATKVAVVKTMARIIRDGGYMERELAAIDECTYFLYYKQNDCYGAIAGKHDDRVMARAIALYVEKDMPAPEIIPFRSKSDIERERLRNRPPVVAELAGIGGS